MGSFAPHFTYLYATVPQLGVKLEKRSLALFWIIMIYIFLYL